MAIRRTSDTTKKMTSVSTVEAVRLATVSVLGLTTADGQIVGGASGAGNLLEDNSEVVSMSVTSLVSSLSDSLMSSDGADIIGIEWILKRAITDEVLPEQLVVLEQRQPESSTVACALAWERGIVDLLRAYEYVQTASRKIEDIRDAAIKSGLDSLEVPAVLKRFAGRLNKVFLVDLMDRRFQSTWDSVRVRPDDIDIETQLVVPVREDFTAVPPCIVVTGIKDRRFILPDADDRTLVNRLNRMVLTPSGIWSLAARASELGQAVLSEINNYAYSTEEYEIAKRVVALLVNIIGSESVALHQVADVIKTADVFSADLATGASIASSAAETHTGSGKSLTLSEHRTEMLESPQLLSARGRSRDVATGLIDTMIGVLERDFPRDEQVPAWRMRSSISHFLSACQRVVTHFAVDVRRYLIVASARAALSEAFQRFRSRVMLGLSDPSDQLLFHKFYGELYTRLNSVFDRLNYQQTMPESLEHLMKAIVDDVKDFFDQLDIWSLIDFADVAQIARSEIIAQHSSGGTLGPQGAALEKILSSMEYLVSDIVPDIAETLLNKTVITRIAPLLVHPTSTLQDTVIGMLHDSLEKSDEWFREASSWLDDYSRTVQPSDPPHKMLEKFIELAHEKVGSGVTARSVLDRLEREASKLRSEYERAVETWKNECSRIRSENEAIAAYNERRARMIEEARLAYQTEMKEYTERLQSASSSGGVAIDHTPVSLAERIATIEKAYPPREPIPTPPAPAVPELLTNYEELRRLIADRMMRMMSQQRDMELVFTENLKSIREDVATLSQKVLIDVSSGLLDFIINSTLRRLRQVLPLPNKTYLRFQSDADSIGVVTYDLEGDEMLIKIGHATLR